jgi:autotransporter-associated beta strand protein
MVASATWKRHPHSADYDDSSNWSIGVVPFAIATFGKSSITHITFSLALEVDAWVFQKDAPHYVFTTVSDHHLYFLGDGIVIKGGSVSLINDYVVDFQNGSSAASARITNEQALYFSDSSTADAARIVNNGGIFQFDDTSSAGKAHITNNDSLTFIANSTSGRAHIVNNASLTYSDSSSAGSAAITNNGTISFEGQSKAGAATIVTTNGHSLLFMNTSSGETAQLIAQAGSLVDFTGAVGPANNHVMPVGSITGAGDFNLGLNEVVVHSGKVSGLILQGITAPGDPGASLEKIGGGKLTLSHAGNAFSGGILLAGGVLDIAAVGAAGSGKIHFDPFIKSTLKIENAALAAHVFGTEIDGFHAGHTLDLAGLRFITHAKATYDTGTHVLTVKSGHVTDTLTLDLGSATKFRALDDGHGGTKVAVVVPHEKSVADHGDSFQFTPEAARGAERPAAADLSSDDRNDTIGAYLHDARLSGIDEVALHPHTETTGFAHHSELFI